MEDRFYTIEQIADLLGMHHKTIRKFINEGKLGANKVGKQWRISGHDLSIFMEKNNFSVDSEKKKDEQSIDFTIGEDLEKQNINVSTVVDIGEISEDEYMRISNTLIAITNCKDSSLGKASINVKYYPKDKKLRTLLWGSVEFIQEVLSSIKLLTEDRDL